MSNIPVSEYCTLIRCFSKSISSLLNIAERSEQTATRWHEEYRKARQENHQLRMELDALKKTTAKKRGSNGNPKSI